MLLDRNVERAALDQLLAAVRTGESGALVLRGEAGIGKTALLDYVAARASGCRIVRVIAVEAEQELAFAALHQICAPMLDRLDRLPDPQRRALSIAFGLSAGSPPDRFVVGLAVLGLLSDLARDQPVVCLVDDAQWLDVASAQVLGFAARRVRAESVVMILAARGGPEDSDLPELVGLPSLAVAGLSDDQARKLLTTSAAIGRIDDRVLDRLIAESHGNPLALLELPRGFTPAELAGGFGLLSAATLPRRIEESYRRQMAALSPSARQVLLVAAAEPTGDPVLVWRAVDRLGIEADNSVSAALTEAGFVEFDGTVCFRHPLLRSAVYQSATTAQRQRVHAALAEVTDHVTDADRRVWQRALAAGGVAEEVAAELEKRAGHAQARGGPAAAAAFLERAAELTPDPVHRGQRFLAAARAKHEAGMPHAGLRLVAMADAGPLDELSHAQADLLRAHIAFAINRGRDIPALLLKAAQRLQPLDAVLARTTYLEAMRAAWYAADLASCATLRDIAHAAAAVPAATPPLSPAGLLLQGLSVRHTEGFAAGVPMLRPALSAFLDPELPLDEALQWSWFACLTALDHCDDDAAEVLTDNFLRLAREAGAVATLPLAMTERIIVLILTGDLAEAGALVEELDNVSQGTGIRWPAYTTQLLSAWAGQEGRTAELVAASLADADRRGEGLGAITSGWAWAVLCNGLGRFEDALDAARKASASSQEMGILTWAPLVELVVAASRVGRTEEAAAALRRLSVMTQACGTEWALGVEALCRALLSDDETEEDTYREAIERLTRTRVRSHLARAHLYFGEWLWQGGHHDEARKHLRTAYDMFVEMGMDAFATLAAGNLGFTGRKRSDESSGQLTMQETQIVRLARDGLSNVEIAARLFISPRTVEWHLSKIFHKLGITSRRQLRRSNTSATAASTSTS
ncbi:AAA family ATPase [Micromonospora sp. NPDC005367]|uniref:helix-turn-helix transcriptional regulator n=1 Tax=Micromonospora sp. NPDC005367 TaxID=3155590 RepID=UPI0033B8EEC6